MSTPPKITTQTIYRGESVFLEGDEARQFYLIKSGAVQLSRVVNDKDQFIAKLGENEIFGESALFDGTPHLFTATAIINTTCMVFPKEVILAKFASSPEAALLICRSLFATMRNE